MDRIQKKHVTNVLLQEGLEERGIPELRIANTLGDALIATENSMPQEAKKDIEHQIEFISLKQRSNKTFLA